MLSKNQLKNITSLHLKKNRDEKKLFIAEGEKLIWELINSGFCISQLFATKEWIKENQSEIFNYEVFEITQVELERISLLSSPNKVMAIVKQKSFNFNKEFVENELSIYLDELRDPGNLGTIIRLAHWFGIKQVICSPGTVELYNPKVVQSSMGSIFYVNCLVKSLKEIMNLNIHNLSVYGASLNGKNIYKKSVFNKGILVIGNESNGISQDNYPFISEFVKIPSNNGYHSESLNAAMASGILLSEYFRRKND